MSLASDTEDHTPQLIAVSALAAAQAVIARVWTPGPGDSCETCAMRPECPDQTGCLHLTGSAGLSERLDGPWRRFPIGAREVGRVPQTLEPFVANEQLAALGLADPAWMMAHDVHAFAALPLARGSECLGVVAVFTPAPIDETRLRGMQAVAALAALALDAAPAPKPLRAAPAARQKSGFDLLRPWDDIERDVLERVLRHTDGKVSGEHGAAKLLQLKPTTLQSRMKKLGVKRP